MVENIKIQFVLLLFIECGRRLASLGVADKIKSKEYFNIPRTINSTSVWDPERLKNFTHSESGS